LIPLTISIHWPSYCTVHAYVVFHFCDSMWSLWVEANLCRFFYRLFIYVWSLAIQLSRGERWDPINRFNPAPFLCLSQAKTWISNVICQSLLCSVSSVKMRDDCSFCWYLGRIEDHHCLIFLLFCWYLGRIEDHHCLFFLFIILFLSYLVFLSVTLCCHWGHY